MPGRTTEHVARPAINGEWLRPRTSSGNATVDIRLPSIDIDELAIMTRITVNRRAIG
jgi:hypothetical protein